MVSQPYPAVAAIEQRVTALSTPWLATAAAPLVAALTLALRLFVPGAPLVPWGDEVLFLLDATRMVRGERIYSDFLQFTTPGTSVTYAALLRVFGLHAWIPKLVMVILGGLLVSATLSISRRILRGRTAYLPPLFVLAFILPSPLEATHHWFSTVLIVAALALLLRSSATPALAATGALCGLAAFFTQNKGAAAALAFAIFLAWDGRRRHAPWLRHCAVLLGSFAVCFAALMSPFLPQAGWTRLFYCLVIFPARYFPAEWYNSWRVYMTEFRGFSDVGSAVPYFVLHALVPLVFVLFLVRYAWRAKSADPQPWRELMLLNVVGLGLFLSVVVAPSLLRLSAAGVPAVVLLVWLLTQPGRAERCLLWGTTALAVLCVLAVPIQAQRRARWLFDTPAGRVAISDARWYEEFRWAAVYTHPGQPFLGNPPLCFALGLRMLGPVPYTSPSAFTRPEHWQQIVDALHRTRAPLLLLRPSSYLPLGPGQDGRAAAPFRAYLQQHYRLARVFASQDEAWVLSGP